VWRQQAIPSAILLASLYGVSDEVHQAFVPFRESSWLDWLADTVGAALGVTAMHWVMSLRPVDSIPEALP
jgi:VanZ family protein